MSPTHTGVPLALSDEELRFLWMACALFPVPESPLAAIADAEREPDDAEAVFRAMSKRGLVLADGAPSRELAERLSVVSECGARISVESSGASRRDFYVAEGRAVEYGSQGGTHQLGPALPEPELVRALGGALRAADTAQSAPLTLSAGDYLVFAVFARDVRDAAPAEASGDEMSLEEVLAYFDTPETKYVRTPSDESWQASVQALAKSGVLVPSREGYSLHPSYHALARGLAAEQQHSVSRLDFFGDEWLVRELTLYPTGEALYRLGTEADGSVVIQELTAAQLVGMLAAVVSTLPDLLSERVSQSTGARAKKAPQAAKSR